MIPDLVFKLGNLAHRGLIGLSRGRVGWIAGKMPVVELTTKGRTTGRARTVMLTSPCKPGDTIVLVASKGGHEHHPDWFLNLAANPEVEVVVEGGPRRAMRARVAEGEEREALWAAVMDNQPRYGGYQDKTSREIPVVVLELDDAR